ncbi:MAG TPA: 4-(cytidine 5'-diphospho)-2-C-methyl-D-erythritol kinase [Acidimicrobiales bacterium]|nr:4-(cytidine 5'-diphospho)-2-C-methyl-D-erythritol kinase [Acidimicrobiales bacterium]
MSSVRAPAKLTLSLRITSVRGDGYHELDAEMVSLGLADTLTFSDGDGLTVGGPHCGGVPMDDSNLVRRALALIGRTASVHVEKQIPSGAGLGGGSADAAAVLRWAGVDDLVVAARLGADVPFCLVGGRARVRGIGDRVTPLPFVDRSFTLITPPLSVSTAAVYQAWDDLGGPSGRGRNDLERAALVVAPELADWRQRIRSLVGEDPVLAGSGSTWFVEGEHPGLVAALPDASVVVTRTDRPAK